VRSVSYLGGTLAGILFFSFWAPKQEKREFDAVFETGHAFQTQISEAPKGHHPGRLGSTCQEAGPTIRLRLYLTLLFREISWSLS
jgi:hypothetical protein